jgi:two-component system response regulator HydG
LRERRDDVPLLSRAFLQRVASQGGGEAKVLTDGAMQTLQEYSWPGNVRELENALERAIILTPGGEIAVTALPERILQRQSEPLVARVASSSPTLDTIERAYIEFVLNSEGGNKTRAAEVLGIDPSTLHRKLARYGDVA